MTGDARRDDHATEHHLESLPADEHAAARAERERQQRERMDAAHEAAKAERPCSCWQQVSLHSGHCCMRDVDDGGATACGHTDPRETGDA